jgi:hypothetical protein
MHPKTLKPKNNTPQKNAASKAWSPEMPKRAPFSKRELELHTQEPPIDSIRTQPPQCAIKISAAAYSKLNCIFS